MIPAITGEARWPIRPGRDQHRAGLPSGHRALIAAPMVSLGGYPTLFAGTAIVALAGSILVWQIKSVP